MVFFVAFVFVWYWLARFCASTSVFVYVYVFLSFSPVSSLVAVTVTFSPTPMKPPTSMVSPSLKEPDSPSEVVYFAFFTFLAYR